MKKEYEQKVPMKSLERISSILENEPNKECIRERILEVKAIQSHLEGITNLYLTSLDLNEVSKNEIRNYYKNELKLKNQEIITLSNKITTMESCFEKKEQTINELKVIILKRESSIEHLNEEIQELKEYKTEIEISRLSKKIEEKRVLINEFKNEKIANKLRVELIEKEKIIADLNKEIQEMKEYRDDTYLKKLDQTIKNVREKLELM